MLACKSFTDLVVRCDSGPSDDPECVFSASPDPEKEGISIPGTIFAIPGDGPIQTDLFPILEYQAPRAFYLGVSSRMLSDFDERTRQADLCPASKRKILAALDDATLRQLFGQYSSVNPELLAQVQLRLEQNSQPAQFHSFAGSVPCLFAKEALYGSAPLPNNADDQLRRLSAAVKSIESEPAGRRQAIREIEELLRKYDAQSSWSASYFGSIAAKASLNERDLDSAKQVWSKHEGYPGDARYRDFYRDVGFDLDFDYVKPHLPSPQNRGFTGMKYYRITGGAAQKEIYKRDVALQAASEHAQHFLGERAAQVQKLAGLLDRPPLVVAPYDAELFGHWWYEGPEFLDFFARKAFNDQKDISLITPGEYLARHPTNQVATPSASSWGEEGYLRAWLNEKNEWIYPHLQVAQERMSALVKKFSKRKSTVLQKRALKQAARELLLAQASDWPFILRAGTSPDYARRRVKDHLLRFIALHDQLTATSVDEKWLAEIESRDNLFPDVDWNYWK